MFKKEKLSHSEYHELLPRADQCLVITNNT